MPWQQSVIEHCRRKCGNTQSTSTMKSNGIRKEAGTNMGETRTEAGILLHVVLIQVKQ